MTTYLCKNYNECNQTVERQNVIRGCVRCPKCKIVNIKRYDRARYLEKKENESVDPADVDNDEDLDTQPTTSDSSR